MSLTLSHVQTPALTEAPPLYYGILTDQGQALLANAIASGIPLPLTQMAIGDGAGQPVTPQPEMTELVNEVHRSPLNQLFVDPTASNEIVAEMVMDETTGGFWIRELGLYDENGILFAVANAPASYKPVLAEGAGRALLTRMVLIVSDASAVELILNPDTVMASLAYVDAKIAEHAASRDHPAAAEGAQGMIPLATPAMVAEGVDHASAVTPAGAAATFAQLQHEHEINDVLWLQEALDEKANLGHTHTPQEAGAAPAGYGLGEVTGRTLSDKSCNEAVAAGWYSVYSGTTDTPQGQGPSGARLMVTAWDSGSHVSQLFFGYESNRIWVRSSLYDDATQAMTWKPWAEIYTHEVPPTAAEVGAISKSGGALDAGAKLTFSGPLNGPDDVALDMGNQSIGGVHGITFSDSSGDNSEAILWPKTGITGADPDLTDYDSFRVIDGVVYINANKMYHQAFKQPGTIGTSTELGANVDLDTMITPGVWHQSANAEASTELHYPEASAGSLVIFAAAGIVQEYRVYNSSRVWIRAQYGSGAWTAWAKQYNTANKPAATDINARPMFIGVIGPGSDWSAPNYCTPGTYQVEAESTGAFGPNAPVGANYGYGLMVCEQGSSFLTQTFYPHSNTGRISQRIRYNGDIWVPWVYLYSTGAPQTAAETGALPVQTFSSISHPPFRVTYTNTTGLPMMVSCNTTGLGYDTNSLVDMSIVLDAGTTPVFLSIKKDSSGEYDDLQKGSGACMVPPGSTFTVNAHDAILGMSTAFALTPFPTASMRLYVNPTTFGSDGVIRAFASDEERDEWAPECSVEVPTIPDGWSHERYALIDGVWVIRPDWLAMVEVKEAEGRRARMMAEATVQTQHFTMMGDTAQADAWRAHYQGLYALTSTPEWPLISQWPTPPSK